MAIDLQPRSYTPVLLIAALSVVVFASAIGVVYLKHENRSLFVALQQQQALRDQLLTEYGQLQLEESTWSTHSRIERLSRDKLSMRVPAFTELNVLSLPVLPVATDERFKSDF